MPKPLQVLHRSVAVMSLFLVLSVAAAAQGQPGLLVPGNHSAEAGDCPKCRPGETSTTVEKLVGHGDYVYVTDPPCSSEVSADVKKLGRELADAALPGLSEAAGGIVDDTSARAVRFISDQARGTIGEILSKYSNPQAQCELLCTVIPQEATFNNDLTLMAGDGDRGVSECTKDNNGEIVCGVGWSKWQEPQFEKNNKTQLICSVFMNWSHDRGRWASMKLEPKRLPKAFTFG
jgi:hypothetical protein